MNKKLRELLEKKGRLITQSRAILEKADKENRNLTAEERTNYDASIEEITGLTQRVEDERRQLDLEREAAERIAADERAGGQGGGAAETPEQVHMRAFRTWIRGGTPALNDGERRALQADQSDIGGYAVPPEQFVRQLIKFVDDAVVIRQLATVQTVTQAESLGAPSLDTDVADADWTSEILKAVEDTAMKFGKRNLHPHPLSKLVKVSNKLLRVSAIAMDTLVVNRLGFKFGVTQEKAFMTGSGAQQPLGVFTASANGISTARDVSDGNTTTEIRFDNLKNVKYTLKPQYWARARWIFHRDAIKIISKLKDGEGRYLWESSVQIGMPDRISGLPVIMSEFAPNTFTTGLYVGILGDFSQYWIADALSMTVQRLLELYAETNQVGFIGRLETDGMPVLEEAFVRVTLA